MYGVARTQLTFQMFTSLLQQYIYICCFTVDAVVQGNAYNPQMSREIASCPARSFNATETVPKRNGGALAN